MIFKVFESTACCYHVVVLQLAGRSDGVEDSVVDDGVHGEGHAVRGEDLLRRHLEHLPATPTLFPSIYSTITILYYLLSTIYCLSTDLSPGIHTAYFLQKWKNKNQPRSFYFCLESAT